MANAARIILNPAALALFGTNAKARVKVENGTIFVRPSNRVSPVNLPKGEFLAPVETMANNRGRFVMRTNIPDAGTKYSFVPNKFGWFALAEGAPSNNQEASARVEHFNAPEEPAKTRAPRGSKKAQQEAAKAEASGETKTDDSTDETAETAEQETETSEATDAGEESDKETENGDNNKVDAS